MVAVVGKIIAQVPLFDKEWFSFSYDMTRVNPIIYKDSIKKNSEQLLQYTAAKIIGELPSSELLNQTGVENLLYNPYANLYDVFILTEKRLLHSPQRFLPNTPRPKNIVLNDASNMFSTVPYNEPLYKDAAITTIQYMTHDLSGTLVTTTIDSDAIEVYQALYSANLTQLKNSSLTFPVGAIGVKQSSSTTYEDRLTFALWDSVNSISDWKASYSANVIFRDYQWSGQTFSCVVDLNNVPTGDCAINYNGNIYRASYLSKGEVNKPYYILFNKIAADAVEGLIKQSFTSSEFVNPL